MGGVRHEHLGFSHIAHRILIGQFLRELLALALHRRIALAFLVFPLHFVDAHHVVLGPLVLLIKEVERGHDGKGAGRVKKKLAHGAAEHRPHGGDAALGDVEEHGNEVLEDDVDDVGENRHLEDVLQEFEEILDREDLLEPLGGAEVLKLRNRGLGREEKARLSKQNSERHAHDEADDGRHDVDGTVDDDRSNLGHGFGKGKMHDREGRRHHFDELFVDAFAVGDRVDRNREHGGGGRDVLPLADVALFARISYSLRCGLFGLFAHLSHTLSAETSMPKAAKRSGASVMSTAK